LPSHVEIAVMLPFVQLASRHLIPLAYRRHAPAPLQVPSFPQLAAPMSLHVALGSAPPGATGLQMPIALAALHCWQTPLQRALQHTPWVQNALPHSASREQGPPSGSLPHIPSRQRLGATHSPSLMHEVPQRLPLHLKPPQVRGATATHAPVLQVLAGVATFKRALQVWFRHTVPSAYTWQPPEPSQRPVVPHDTGPWSAQIRAASVTPAAALGSSTLAPTGTQRPSEVASPQ
jgi:hypothetical protein